MERLAVLRANKDSLLARLREKSTPATVSADPSARYEPFPLTDVQAAYLLGRNDAFEFGGVACHVYLEVNYPKLDPLRVEAAWNQLIGRHDMLRVVINSDAYQRVLPSVPQFAVPVMDGRGATPERIDSALEAIRAEMAHRVHQTTRWPMFEVRTTLADERAVLHLSMDFLVADWASIWLLLGEFERLHADPTHALPALDVRFRDYLLAERRLRETDRFQCDRDYWWARLDALPPAPELPVLEQPGARTVGPLRRRVGRLNGADWNRLKERAQQRGLTPSSVVLAAYAATLERWSRTRRFSLNLTLLNRLPLHEQVGHLVGDFTSVSLLAVDWQEGSSFAQRATTICGQLFDDLDHRLCSGVE
ncbi:MAG TPA: condensation domain-containing protein, partial [Polyangiaceae bacterium]